MTGGRVAKVLTEGRHRDGGWQKVTNEWRVIAYAPGNTLAYIPPRYPASVRGT